MAELELLAVHIEVFIVILLFTCLAWVSKHSHVSFADVSIVVVAYLAGQ